MLDSFFGGITQSGCNHKVVNENIWPLPVVNVVTTPISRVVTLVAHLSSAIYRGPSSPHLFWIQKGQNGATRKCGGFIQWNHGVPSKTTVAGFL